MPELRSNNHTARDRSCPRTEIVFPDPSPKPGAQGHSKTTPIEIPEEVPFTLALGAFIALLPATRLYDPLVRAYQARGWLRGLTIALLIVVYVLAVARAVAVPFQPFIYFRF